MRMYLPVVVMGLAAMGALSACSGASNGGSSAAPPTVICGETINHSASGAVVYDIGSGRSLPPVESLSASGLIFVKVSDACDRGSEIAIMPPGSLKVVRSVRTTDGRYAAVALEPTQHGRSTIAATRDGNVLGTLDINL